MGEFKNNNKRGKANENTRNWKKNKLIKKKQIKYCIWYSFPFTNEIEIKIKKHMKNQDRL